MSRAAKPSSKTPELGESSLLLPLCPSFQGSDHLGGCREDVEGKVITVFYLIGANIALSGCCLPRGKHRILGYVTDPHEHSSEVFVGASSMLGSLMWNVSFALTISDFSSTFSPWKFTTKNLAAGSLTQIQSYQIVDCTMAQV